MCAMPISIEGAQLSVGGADAILHRNCRIRTWDIADVRLLGAFSVRAGKQSLALPSRSAQSPFAYLILTAATA